MKKYIAYDGEYKKGRNQIRNFINDFLKRISHFYLENKLFKL